MTESSTIIILCPSCSQQLRVPTDLGSLKLSCHACRTSWKWSPPALLEESRELFFRCAQTGTRFQVAFRRENPSQRFWISKISFHEEKDEAGVGQTASIHSFSAADFDLAGWECPCCGHAKHRRVNQLFVQCTKCSEYVCEARVQQIDGGGTIFTCHDGCGGSCRVERELTIYTGLETESENEVVHKGASERSLPKVLV